MIAKAEFTGPMPGRITEIEKKAGLYGTESKAISIPERVEALCKHFGFTEKELASQPIWEKVNMVQRRSVDASQTSPVAAEAHETEVLPEKKAETFTTEELAKKHVDFVQELKDSRTLIRDAMRRQVAAGLKPEPPRASTGETNPLLADALCRAAVNDIENRKEQNHV